MPVGGETDGRRQKVMMRESGDVQAHVYRAALYMRLSKEDGQAHSESIENQRKILRNYADEHAFAVYGEYIDDGVSGTTFVRPGFLRMIADIECGRINMVITKDLSRLGRDYITAGQYTERFFPEHGVRFIALGDGYDSDAAGGDIAPFQHVMNEMYARDISRKIRAALSAKMREGAFIGGFAPYGYQKHAQDKNRLTPDPGSAPVVRRIFSLAQEGKRPSEIAKYLNERQIAPPLAYRAMQRRKPGELLSREWTSATICKMLKNVVYLGHMAQGKTRKASLKSGRTRRLPAEDWHVVKHTHPALVSEATFEAVNRRIVARRASKRGGFTNVFSGIARCADCGHSMSTAGTRRQGALANLTCGSYKLYGKIRCTNHFVDYEALCTVVKGAIKRQVARASLADVARRVRQNEEAANDTGEDVQARASLRRRAHALDVVIARLYEDMATGVLGKDRFCRLLASYETEQKDIFAKLQLLDDCADGAKERDIAGVLARSFQDAALARDLLLALVDHIEIGQGCYKQGEQGRVRRLVVTIHYRFGDQGHK